jgi:hypothetical protein
MTELKGPSFDNSCGSSEQASNRLHISKGASGKGLCTLGWLDVPSSESLVRLKPEAWVLTLILEDTVGVIGEDADVNADVDDQYITISAFWTMTTAMQPVSKP